MDSPVLEIASKSAEKKTTSLWSTAPAQCPTFSCIRWSSRPKTASSLAPGVPSTGSSSITASRELRHSDQSEENPGGRKVSCPAPPAPAASSSAGRDQSLVWDFPSEVCLGRKALHHCLPVGTVWRRRRGARERKKVKLPSPREISNPRYR